MTQDELKRILDYDSESGNLIWKINSGAAKVGNYAGTYHDGYKRIGIKRNMYLAHRLVWLYHYGYFPECDIDHINRDRHDNRIDNLRLCTKTQNNQNASVRSDNTSGYKGVSYSKPHGKWRAQINRNGKRVYLGLFDNKDDAYKTYCNAANSICGEFANLG